MAKNKAGRPEWFKFWRRNRRQLDIEQLGMESRGVVFTNMMRYFDADDTDLLPMNPLESMAFNVVKISVDDSFTEYAERQEINRTNGCKGGRPPKTNDNRNNQMGYEITEKTRIQKTEERRKNTEDRSGTTRSRFVPPTLEEVKAYCKSRSSSVNPARFFEYYDEGGWVDSKGQPVKSWKQKLLTWEHKEQKSRDAGQTANLDWRNNERSITPDDLVEYPPGSGQYRPRWEVDADG